MISAMIQKLVRRENLSFYEAQGVMAQIMDGEATAAQIGSLLTALRMKGETVEEIAGCAQIMKAKACPFHTQYRALLDTCGTGGDGSGTFNISTTVAFVAAGAGVPVAKHGNRSVSSRCGSADVLEALGVKIDLNPQEMEQVLQETKIGFLYAPLFHRTMKHVIGPRREVGIRSIFNLLGPLTNPAGAKVQVLGVYQPELTQVLAQVLDRLKVESAYVVHGAGGLDEISTLGSTKITFLRKGSIKNETIFPEDFGITRATRKDIAGGDAHRNAEITKSILQGQKGPCRDIVLLNSAAAFTVYGLARNLAQGMQIARESIDSGKAMEKLDQLIAATNQVRQQGVMRA